MSKTAINDVSDTALWVAVYRAIESQRPDALFQDPFAARLAGEQGRNIAAVTAGSHYTAWSVVIRTHIIDSYIQELIREGIDTVVNLGAGLDARPYRMDLPASLRWIEVDFPHMIAHKQKHLSGETAKCRLEQVGIDLSDDHARQQLLRQIAESSKNVLILTEGVVIYLTPEQVTQLAKDLASFPSFRHWIVDYFSPRLLPYFRSRRRMRQMQNAPLRFIPEDWFGFFAKLGWKSREVRYIGEESLRLGRKVPMPWWAVILQFIFRFEHRPEHLKLIGYVLLEPLA